MKILIVFNFLIFSVFVNASSWYAVGKAGALGSFGSKSNCETTEMQSCFDIVGKHDLRRWKVGKDGLVPDPAGIIAADAADAQKVTDDGIRATKKGERDTDLDICIQDTVSGVLTLPQASACIRALVREARGLNVAPVDL